MTKVKCYVSVQVTYLLDMEKLKREDGSREVCQNDSGDVQKRV